MGVDSAARSASSKRAVWRTGRAAPFIERGRSLVRPGNGGAAAVGIWPRAMGHVAALDAVDGGGAQDRGQNHGRRPGAPAAVVSPAPALVSALGLRIVRYPAISGGGEEREVSVRPPLSPPGEGHFATRAASWSPGVRNDACHAETGAETAWRT
jgi:hypothetical protein